MMPEDSSSSGQERFAANRRGGIEAIRVMLRQQRQHVGRRIVLPDLADMGVVADILLHEDLAVLGDGHVVEHLLPFGAVEQHLDGAAGRRVGRRR